MFLLISHGAHLCSEPQYGDAISYRTPQEINFTGLSTGGVSDSYRIGYSTGGVDKGTGGQGTGDRGQGLGFRV